MTHVICIFLHDINSSFFVRNRFKKIDRQQFHNESFKVNGYSAENLQALIVFGTLIHILTQIIT